jgi:hypothetical protein
MPLYAIKKYYLKDPCFPGSAKRVIFKEKLLLAKTAIMQQ